MKSFLTIAQILISAVLIGLIIVQARGTGLGRAFGSSQTSFTRRGLEGLIFRLTFFFSALFILVSLAALLI